MVTNIGFGVPTHGPMKASGIKELERQIDEAKAGPDLKLLKS